jgi:hypothetical protein
MYADPRHIRANIIKISLNDDEMANLELAAEYLKTQKATLVREFVMKQINDELCMGMNSKPIGLDSKALKAA